MQLVGLERVLQPSFWIPGALVTAVVLQKSQTMLCHLASSPAAALLASHFLSGGEPSSLAAWDLK